jgi:hypothetical protein
MITIEKCREILGKRFKNCTDEQIRKIIQFLYKLAEIDGMQIKNRVK